MNKFTDNFQTCHNDAEVRSVFRLLALKYHPDKGGSDEDMRLLIDAYQEALKGVDGVETENNGRPVVYRYNEGEELELVEKLKEILALKFKNNKDWVVMLIGRWIWLDKTAKEDKDLLNKKGAKMWWSNDKEMWYWHSATPRRYYNGKGNFMMMAWKYGYSEIKDVKKNDVKRLN